MHAHLALRINAVHFSMAHSYFRASARLTVNFRVISYIRQRRVRLSRLLLRCWYIVSLVRLLSRRSNKTFTSSESCEKLQGGV